MPTLTVLDHAANKPQTKNFETGESYKKTKHVRKAERVRFKNLRDLQQLLTDLSEEPTACVIRGVLRPDAPIPLRRRKTHFEDTPQSWVMLDIDALRAPKRLRTSGPYTDAHAAFAAASLPDAFSGVSCVWQASASAGRDPKVLKLHLWFMLDRPLTCVELRSWLKGAAIDPSTLRSVQPHYTAAPIGATWYSGSRVGLLRGALKRVSTPEKIDAPEHSSEADVPLRREGSANVSRETIERSLVAATKRAQAELDGCSVAYQSAYTIGAILGPAVALETWNDAEHGHTLWEPTAGSLARRWGQELAALPGASHSEELYERRVYAGVCWGVARERERLNLQTEAAAQKLLAATKELREALMRKAGRNAGSLQKMQEVAAELGRYVHLQKRADVVAMLVTESGFSEQQVSDALEIGEANPVGAEEWREGLVLNTKRPDEIEPIDSNLLHIYSTYPGFATGFRFNVRTKQLEAGVGNPLGLSGDVNFDALPNILVPWLKQLGCAKISLNAAYAAFRAVMHTFLKYDPFLDAFPEAEMTDVQACQELAAIEPKLDTWLIDHFGAKDCEYTRLVGAKALISAVARAVRPGAQVDTLLILQGEQGIGKTKVLRKLANVVPQGYQELLDMRDKDSLIAMNDGLIVEVSELKALRYSNIETSRAFFSRQRDRIRAPYARAAEDFDRRIVFVGTTNDHEFLAEYERRYWPIACTNICRMTKAQAAALWREAALRYACGEKWWLRGAEKDLHRRASGRFQTEDVLESVLAPWLRNKNRVTLAEVLEAIPEKHRATTPRVARMLRLQGFRRRLQGKKRVSVWVRG